MSTLSGPSPKLGIVRHMSGPPGPSDAELVANLKRTLLITALKTPPRFRSDIDVVMIQHHLASLGVFASVAPQILKYLATECTITRIPDGDVLFYQEDIVDDYSHAYIVLEGSLCGYFNKAFSERHSRGDDFRSWNSKKTNAKGVTIDFGDLQVTYGKGAICGIDDFYLCSLPSSSRESRRHLKPLCRRRSVHSQESTTIIMLAKDSLDRVTERFGLVYERGTLTSTKETSRTDVAHLALFSLLSETARRTLLQSATTRELKAGEVLFSPDAERDSCATAFAIVRAGCLNIHCVEYGDTPSPDMVTTNSQSNATAGTSNVVNVATSTIPVPNGAVASLGRGQAFGDQMVALGHSHIWASNPRRRRQVPMRFKVAAGDASTEVLLITREQYEQLMRDDLLRLSYTPIFGAPHSSAPLSSIIDSRDICQVTRYLLTDATLSKFFFQFPPIVLERLCHHMEIQHFESNDVLLEAGATIDSVYIVVTGALHSHHFQGSDNSRNTGNKALVHQTSARRVSLEQEVHFIPGDAFGARELMKRCYTSDAPVLADAGTTLLCVTRSTFERWVSPMRHNTIVKAGSILQPFVWSNSSPPASPRHSYSSSYSSSVKVNRRQSGPSLISSAVVEPERGKARRLEEAAILLKRFGLFQTLPRFLLAQMLTQVSLQRKNAGEEVFREGDSHRALVVILSGFVSFYSIENMSATVDMLQKHPFCSYSSFSGSTASPEDFVSERRTEDNSAMSPSAALKHRGAMHGVHIQTLPPRNAFRTGVLQEGTVCPATVVAQTDCEYLVFDEKVYAKLLAEHTPAVDMSTYVSPSETSASPAVNTGPGSVPQPTPKAPAPMTERGTPPSHLLAYLEAARIPWLPLSAAKKTLLLRSMIHIHLAPGQRLVKHNDILKQLVFVVSGKLAVYVRENKEVTSILNASQRSVQSAALERSVASNYSTTSQQLFQERDGIDGISNRKALQRKIARIAEVETESEEKATSPNSRFTDFVLHAAKQAKARQSSKAEGQQTATPNPPVGARRSLHSVVNKVKFQHTTGDSSTSNPADEKKESTKALFMLHLCPGDIYGDEITAPVGTFRSVHDVYADTSLNGNSGGKEKGNDRPHVLSPGTEILCLDRQVLHSILAKTEEEAANELIGRSSNAKAKWQLASKKLFKRASHGAIDQSEGYIKLKKTPKLFDFFKNILNQRRFLTMGTLAHFPLLRDLSEDARRELCLNARFEALDRYTDAYKGNEDANGSGNRFFLLLTGRIHLVANGPNSHIVTQNASSTTSEHNLREVGAGEGFGEFTILVPEAPLYTAAIAAEPTKLLSIPSGMFMRHWPCTDDARGNIEYLRSQISSFVSLDLERIAYLYHSFSFQTHIRGTNIFQLQRGSSSTKEVYFIKEGTCCIRQNVILVRRPNGDFRYEPCEDETASGCSQENHPSQQKKATKTIKILATVADVGVGHVFWVDSDHHPITLVATSAAVTIASIPVDKLKAIVPRGLLVGLEDLSDQLRELYDQQYLLAKRVTATVMNEKLAAPSQRLPTIQPCAAQSSDKLQQCSDILSPCGSPLKNHVDNVTDNDLGESALRTDADATYKVQHRVERYDIPSDVSVTTLIGSFLDKNHASGDTKVVEDQPEWVISPKQDECSGAEATTQPTVAHQNEEVSNMLRLNVKIPVADHLSDGSPSFRNIAKATAASAEWRRRSMKSSRGVTGLPLAMEKVIGSNQEDPVMFEVDVRARVRAQMCTIESPMRAMRLEPSSTPVNSLGKYFADSPSPFAGPGESYQRRHLGLLHYLHTPPAEARTKPQHQKPAKALRPNAKQMQIISPSDAPSHAALTRKQGFLTMLRVRSAVSFDGDGRDILDAILPRVHQGRRFFYALIDSELREYADTIALSNLSQTPCLRRYALHNPRRQCTVSDVPVTPGQAEALLRQSFLLSIDDTTQLLFTAASAIDKQKWMTELNQARVLGGLQHPVSIKVQSPRPSAATPPPGDPAALAAVVIDAFKGRRKSSIKGRKRSSIFVPKPKPEDTLHVEYRIS